MASFSPLFQRVLAARGFWQAGQLTPAGTAFLRPDFTQLAAPATLPDMAQAIKRLRQAKAQGEKILIFGDYDADGVTATAVLVLALRALGYDVVYDLPERTVDGYGLPARVVPAARAQNIRLIITVDCGSRDAGTIQTLREQGVDVIITDHHEIGGLPPAVAVVNPKRADHAGFHDYSGVGVAWQFARAAGLSDPAAKWLLDLVAIGTLCDLMPLERDNRLIVHYGLLVLNKTKHLGLKELLRLSGSGPATTDTIGFRLGPRLNAAGRIASPRLSLELLLADTRAAAARLAAELDQLNNRRQELVEAALAELTDDQLVVVGRWHEGIIGLIAGRLVEQTGRPSFVFTETDAGDLKGSARSTAAVNLVELIDAARVQGLIQKGGGHAAAAGLTIRPEHLDDFRQLIEAKISEVFAAPCDNGRQVERAAPVTTGGSEASAKASDIFAINHFSELTADLLDELNQLAPFGLANPEPLFSAVGLLTKCAPMGRDRNHLSLVLADTDAKTFRLVKFNAPAAWQDLPAGEPLRAVFKLRANTWGGKREVEGELIDVAVDVC